MREHIEGQHMAEIQRSTKNPMCGCSRTFDNERELRHHLHDMHGLNETIWQNPKPPRKRKRACKLEEHCSSAERPKKFGFYPYQPPHNEDQKSPPGNMSAAIPAPVSFVEEHPGQYYCSGTSDKSSTNSTNSTSASSRSTSIASCFSAAHSQLSSRPTSPSLDVIDPRILKPIDFDMEDGCQYDDQVPIQLDSTNPSVNEPEANNEPFGGIIQPKPPVASFANSTREDCADNEAEEETSKALRADCPTFSDNQAAKDKREEHPHKQAALEVKIPCCDDQADVSSARGPLTRAKTKSQPALRHLDDFNSRKTRKKLNAKEKRQILEFKGQNLTLRQIGPHFADIDTAVLRQAWKDMELPQRCTRSRASRRGG